MKHKLPIYIILTFQSVESIVPLFLASRSLDTHGMRFQLFNFIYFRRVQWKEKCLIESCNKKVFMGYYHGCYAVRKYLRKLHFKSSLFGRNIKQSQWKLHSKNKQIKSLFSNQFESEFRTIELSKVISKRHETLFTFQIWLFGDFIGIPLDIHVKNKRRDREEKLTNFFAHQMSDRTETKRSRRPRIFAKMQNKYKENSENVESGRKSKWFIYFGSRKITISAKQRKSAFHSLNRSF